ncbi:hypothetical protein ACS8YF_17100 [Salinisphaera sp. SWV1]|uniref:hypothetical protein n=1 Tax=Salinisphaera sp. SWV1 TaxID=3454139 RepID=UPI003F859C80
MKSLYSIAVLTAWVIIVLPARMLSWVMPWIWTADRFRFYGPLWAMLFWYSLVAWLW